MGKIIDITNQKFGKLTVLEQTSERKRREIVWKCQCECGNICYVTGYKLRTGHTQSCGCLKKENIKNVSHLDNKRIYDITGEKFGELEVVKYLYTENGNRYWQCLCSCGNVIEVTTSQLHAGYKKSCGCKRIISKNEDAISDYLLEAKIPFIRQYKIIINENLSLFCDFFIDNHYILEYDGRQHFKYSNNGWNTEKQVKETHNRDMIKNNYCFNNNIPIIRIPYDKEWNKNDLFLESTNFLLTKENIEKYYSNRIAIGEHD